MYQNIYFDRQSNIIHLWDDVNGYEKFKYSPYAYRKRSGGPYRSIFGDELEKIYRFNPKDQSLFESDVAGETRTLIDIYADDDNVSQGHVILNFDIEVGTEGGYASADDPYQPIISIAFKDSVSKIRRVYVLDVDGLVEDYETEDDKGKIIVLRFDEEDDLLLTFMEEYKRIRPTILTGWHIDGFDVPYLYNRLKTVIGHSRAKQLSPIGVAFTSPKGKDGLYRTTIAGVSCLDLLKLYKLFTYKELANYRLDTVGRKEVGMGKVEYEGDLNQLFKSDIGEFIKYNLTDVDIVDAIDGKNKFIELAMSICHICHVPYEFIHFSSKYLEGALLLYLRKRNLIAPNKPPKKVKTDDDVGFEGAYVKAPTPGKYEWIFDLDLTSLYPSIIMSLNISPETLLGKVYSHIEPEKPKENGKKNEMIPAHPAWSPEDFVSGKVTKVFLNEDAAWENAEIGDGAVSVDDFRKKLTNNNITIASNGALYDNNKVGLLGDILDIWFNQRVEYRNLESDYGIMASGDFSKTDKPIEYFVKQYGYKEGDKKQSNEFDAKYKFYNKRQKVQKILLNSLYGVLGLSIFRFYNLTNAEAVTLTGQTIIKTSAKMGNMYYNKVLGDDIDYCIYTDTDSTFFSALPIIKKTMPEVDLDDDEQMAQATIEIAGVVQKRLNTGYNMMALKMFNIDPDKHRFNIKQEIVAKRGIWIAKKRYVQWVINEGGIAKDELDVKGLDVVRSSFPTKFKNFMWRKEKVGDKKVDMGIIVDFLKDADKQEIDKKILEFRHNVSSYKVDDVARNTSIKEVSKYIIDREKAGAKKKDGKCMIGHFPKVKDAEGKTKAFPAHIKAAINFNDFLVEHELNKIYEPMFDGEKIKYVYLKQNPWGLEEIAFRGYKDPPELMEFVNMYADGKELYVREMAKKLDDFYDALKWQYPSDGDKVLQKYFNLDTTTKRIPTKKAKWSKGPPKKVKRTFF